jgi:hypothetical protein
MFLLSAAASLCSAFFFIQIHGEAIFWINKKEAGRPSF